MANHVALLGDSIFDNRSYTRGEPDVVAHLRALLPSGWQATLVAADGATTGDVERQLSRVPGDASHLVLSVGGNDALMNSDVLTARVSSAGEALELLAARACEFETDYRRAVSAVLALGRRTTLCTIYNGNLEAGQARIARVALTVFNDAILRTAVDRGVDVIELRMVCAEAADYANPIEPSGRGGLKIAGAIAKVLSAASGNRIRSSLVSG